MDIRRGSRRQRWCVNAHVGVKCHDMPLADRSLEPGLQRELDPELDRRWRALHIWEPWRLESHHNTRDDDDALYIKAPKSMVHEMFGLQRDIIERGRFDQDSQRKDSEGVDPSEIHEEVAYPRVQSLSEQDAQDRITLLDVDIDAELEEVGINNVQCHCEVTIMVPNSLARQS